MAAGLDSDVLIVLCANFAKLKGATCKRLKWPSKLKKKRNKNALMFVVLQYFSGGEKNQQISFNIFLFFLFLTSATVAVFKILCCMWLQTFVICMLLDTLNMHLHRLFLQYLIQNIHGRVCFQYYIVVISLPSIILYQSDYDLAFDISFYFYSSSYLIKGFFCITD